MTATPPQRRPWIEAGSLARSSTRAWCCRPTCPVMALIDAVRKAPASEYLLVEPTGPGLRACWPPVTWIRRFAGV